MNQAGRRAGAHLQQLVLARDALQRAHGHGLVQQVDHLGHQQEEVLGQHVLLRPGREASRERLERGGRGARDAAATARCRAPPPPSLHPHPLATRTHCL